MSEANGTPVGAPGTPNREVPNPNREVPNRPLTTADIARVVGVLLSEMREEHTGKMVAIEEWANETSAAMQQVIAQMQMHEAAIMRILGVGEGEMWRRFVISEAVRIGIEVGEFAQAVKRYKEMQADQGERGEAGDARGRVE